MPCASQEAFDKAVQAAKSGCPVSKLYKTNITLAATLALWRERRFLMAVYCGLVSLVFAYTLGDNCLERPDGLIIGTIFIRETRGIRIWDEVGGEPESAQATSVSTQTAPAV